MRKSGEHISNAKTYADEYFGTGGNVYYKRQNYKGWYGSNKVLGKESQYVYWSDIEEHFSGCIHVTWWK